MKHMMVMLMLTLLVSSVRAEIFRDNFNDGDLQGWTFVQGAENGGVQNSELVLSSPKAEFGAEVIIAVDGIISSDYEMAVSVKISRLAREINIARDINGGLLIGLRAHAPPDLEPFIERFQRNKKLRRLLYEQSYQFILGYRIGDGVIKRGFGATIQHVEISQKGNRWDIDIEDKSRAFRLFDFRLHEWYRLKIIAKGNRFQCFIDDKEMLDFLDDTYTAGKIYLSSGLGNRVHFDDFDVQYDARPVQRRRKLTTTWGEIKGDFH